MLATKRPLIDSGWRNITRKVPAGCVLSLAGLPEGRSVATIPDISGNGNHSTITGATGARLPSGQWYLSFDGTNDYVNCGQGASLNLTGALTIKAWVKLDNELMTDTNATVIGKFKTTAAGDFQWYLSYRSTGADRGFELDVADATGSITSVIKSNWTPIVGTWILVHAVYVPSTSMTLYVNGSVHATLATGVPDSLRDTTTPECWIGAAGNAATSYNFEGDMALWEVISGAQNVVQIASSYNRERHLFRV